MAASPSSPLPHIAIFPFMSKGHTIPLLHLAHLIHRLNLATLTFFTTPLNTPFLRHHLSGTNSTIIQLPFPQDIPGLPDGVESTDTLPSMSLFLPFLVGIEKLRTDFEHALENTPSISFLISDGFLGWTNASAAKFGIPRVVFYGMGIFVQTIINIVNRDRPHVGLIGSDKVEPFTVTDFPHLQLTKSDLLSTFHNPNLTGPMQDFVAAQMKARRESHGMLFNSFYELEADYLAYWNRNMAPRAWCVGPLCLASREDTTPRPEWMQWLDSHSSVLYVAFGTQAQVSAVQLREIAVGLESSGVEFLWIVRGKSMELEDGFEERVAERGRVVREWVDQMEILGHESVKGFMSHCGWNSVMEAVSNGVPILAWPMMAEQHLNAKFVVEELGVGLRAGAASGGGGEDKLVKGEDVEVMVRELLMGEKGKEVARKVKVLAEVARKGIDVGGSSQRTLELMIDEICGNKAQQDSHVTLSNEENL